MLNYFKVPDKMKPFQVSSGAENRVEIKVIKTLIISYFDIVKVRLKYCAIIM